MSPVLVKLDVACRHLSASPDDVFAMVDGSSIFGKRLEWVFDFARTLGDGKRDLRFWLGELMAREARMAFPRLSLEQALERIAPPSISHWPTGRMESEFQIRRNTIQNLRVELGQPLGMIPRAKLVKFLTARWLGCLQINSRRGTEKIRKWKAESRKLSPSESLCLGGKNKELI